MKPDKDFNKLLTTDHAIGAIIGYFIVAPAIAILLWLLFVP